MKTIEKLQKLTDRTLSIQIQGGDNMTTTVTEIQLRGGVDSPSILFVGESFSVCAMLGGLWFELVKTKPACTSGALDFDTEKVIDKFSVCFDGKPYNEVVPALLGK